MTAAWTEDWTVAGAAFRQQVQERGGTVERVPTGEVGPLGEQLTIDVGVLGRLDASLCVVVSSGLHGVEGIAGSAIQREWLATRTPPADCRLVVIHLVNPYGFAWQRRVDAHNVDLNRNFLVAGERYEGAAPAWEKVRPWLCPPRAPRRYDPLLPHLLSSLPRIGRRQLLQAVAGGQYVTPDAIFFGGSAPAALQDVLRAGLARWVGSARDVIHLDLHTGVGSAGALQVFLPHVAGTPEAARLTARFGDIARPAREQARYYRVRGGLAAWALTQFGDISYDVCYAEFGTVSPLSVLRALRRENSAWFHCDYDDERSRQARRRLVAAFAPAGSWRDTVLAQGIDVIDAAVAA